MASPGSQNGSGAHRSAGDGARQAGTKGEGSTALTVAALGVVFGDIGTSPLYALRECFAPEHGLRPDPANVLGVVSLLLWSLTIVVSLKYVLIVLRADNRGEGGILALINLVGSAIPKTSRRRALVIAGLGIVGAALLYSDGLITPAISVLSAVEGLRDFSPALSPYVLPITLVVLTALFPFQSRGTAKVGRLFGPIVILWFVAIAVLGAISIASTPSILLALDPRHAIAFTLADPARSLQIMGFIFLAMTGAEVLYADLGHFGRAPVTRAWFSLVYPALLLDYLGQGAWLLGHPDGGGNLFFNLVPGWLGLPMVALATAATIIASQAVISGAFSLARQSVQLGYWPRMQVRHTSERTEGQIYVPFVNWFLFLGTIALVLAFRESGNLASAYGIAVSATMLITTCLMLYVTTRIWRRGLWYLLPLELLFLALELVFVASNLGKIASGGWVVAAMAAIIFILMKTWRDGRRAFGEKMAKFRLDPETFAESIALNPPTRIPGTAVFMTANPNGVPKALLHSLKNYRVLHARTIILTVRTLEVPRILEEPERGERRELKAGIWTAVLNFGFSETPDVPWHARSLGIPDFDPKAMDTTWFTGREILALSRKGGAMSWFRKRIFAFMFSNALNPSEYYRLPINRTVELGAQTEL